MSLQEDFDLLSPHDIFTLNQGEYKGPLIIRKPCEIIGINSVIWAQNGPVVEIHAKGVTLKNIQLEITGNEKNSDPVAITAEPESNPSFENVIINGKVIGIPRESETWDYPKSYNLGSLQPNRGYKKEFRIISPIACNIKSDISSVTIENAQLIRGFNDVILIIEPLPPDTIITGKLFIISQFTRIINIYGAVTEKLAIPDNRDKSPIWIQLIDGQRFEFNNLIQEVIIGAGWHSSEFIKHRVRVSGIAKDNDSGKLKEIDLSPFMKNGYIKLNNQNNIDKFELFFQLNKLEKICEKILVSIFVDPIVGGINNFSHLDKLYIRGIAPDSRKEDFFYPIDSFSPLDNAITLFEIYQYKKKWKLNPIGKSYRQ